MGRLGTRGRCHIGLRNLYTCSWLVGFMVSVRFQEDGWSLDEVFVDSIAQMHLIYYIIESTMGSRCRNPNANAMSGSIAAL